MSVIMLNYAYPVIEMIRPWRFEILQRVQKKHGRLNIALFHRNTSRFAIESTGKDYSDDNYTDTRWNLLVQSTQKPN